MIEKIYGILHTWFGENPPELEEASQHWWVIEPSFSKTLHDEFYEVLQSAKENTLEPWKGQPHGCLAFILLCDQIPRHLYPNQAKAFETDSLALKACKKGLEHKFDKDLQDYERIFFYLPISHSENLDDQNKSLMLYRNLLEEAQTAKSSHVSMIQHAESYAQKRYEMIAQFGRFPH